MPCRLTGCMLMNSIRVVKVSLNCLMLHENIPFLVQEMRVKWHWLLFKHHAETVEFMGAQSRINMALTQLTTYSAQTVNLHLTSHLAVK